MFRCVKQSSFALALCGLLSLLIAAPALAQNPTGTITGRVVDSQGLPITGVTVTVTSPALQGVRTTRTTENGDFILPLLPPGAYTIAVELQGFSAAKRTANLAASEAIRVDLTMTPAAVQEEIVVTGRQSEAFVGTIQNASSFTQDFIRSLPTAGTILSAVNLASGTHNTGPSGNVSFAGAMSFENIFMINGVQITDNVRGTPFTLFIEDAIQETTVMQNGISAEYGRFSGGVVNTITKSGGNEFSGSFRTTFTNDKWRTLTPFEQTTIDDGGDDPRISATVPTYEYTLGGRIVRDRTWFFGAGRNFNQEAGDQTGFTNIPFAVTTEEARFEGKITQAINPSHRIQGSYTGIRRSEDGNTFPNAESVMDLRSLVNRKLPQNLYSVHYTGILGSDFFLEGQFSKRDFTFQDDGATTTDLIEGTQLINQQTQASWWSPRFCGVCVPEERSNESFVIKANQFLSTARGSHNVTFGYDYFNDKRKGENHQTGSDFDVRATDIVIRDNVIYPVLDADTVSWIVWWPVLEASLGTNFRTHSFFVNDSWAYNKNFTFNLGLRLDKNDGVDAAGQKVADDAGWSPRLGVVWDPRGDGQWAINTSYGRYIAALANTIGDSASPAGTPATYAWDYLGPPINTDPNGPLVPSDEALRMVFDWFETEVGGSANTSAAWFKRLPGLATQIRDSLKSAYTDEYVIGVSRRLSRGALRADFVRRNYGNFYAGRIDTTTGTIPDPNDPDGLLDLELVENTDKESRDYAALNLQGNWRVTPKVRVGGSYSLSRLWGTVDGETIGSGPVRTTVTQYPEFADPVWNNPEGDLSSDQRHRARIWANIDLIENAKYGSVSLGLLQQTESGTPYGAIGAIDSTPFVNDPGYQTPPPSVTYFFTPRDQFRTEAMHRFDLAVNYDFEPSALKGARLFAQFHVLNLFNQFNVAIANGGSINTSVDTALNKPELFATFNPFTETPVQGVHWDFAPESLEDDGTFGKVIGSGAYTLPRTFRFSIGVRF
jgi:outer membrane receptor protein involved in Fe transport